MTSRRSLLVAPLALTAAAQSPPPTFEQRLKKILPAFGHRNWIVVADSAYPAQARPSIETLVTNTPQLTVVQTVLKTLAASRHVTPKVYTDRELQFVPESAAPGIDRYRKDLAQLLSKFSVSTLPHEELIARLDQAGQTFQILLIKTPLAIPYTSVFFELDCAYWSPEAERQLRKTMEAAK